MNFVINGDANQTRVVNQCIELMTNFKASNGLLYIKSADRTHIEFIFQPNNKDADFETEKRKAELEWSEHLLKMVKTEVGNVAFLANEDSVIFSFDAAKQKGKRNGKKRTA